MKCDKCFRFAMFLVILNRFYIYLLQILYDFSSKIEFSFLFVATIIKPPAVGEGQGAVEEITEADGT